DRAEAALAGGGQSRVGLDAGQALHVGGHLGDADVAADRRRQRRHGGLATVQDGLEDVVGGAGAPLPAVVGQVGEALGAARVGSVAERAVVGEQAAAEG